MGWVSVTIPGFFLLYILRPHARCELEIRYENGRLWLEKTAVETVLKRQQIMAAIKQIEGSANANLGLSSDEMMALTRSEV